MRTLNGLNYLGQHISVAIQDAITEANEHKESVSFEFNGTKVVVKPGDDAEDIFRGWVEKREAEQEAWRKSPEGQEYEKRQREEAEKLRKREEAGVVHDEDKLRDLACPKVETIEDLVNVVNTYRNGKHTYGTSAYAAAIVAEAAFNFMARELGLTGFQAGFASMRLVGRIKNIDGPFMIMKARDALYPQMDLRGHLQEALDEWKPWLQQEAQQLLDENQKRKETMRAHANVVARWRHLASGGAP